MEKQQMQKTGGASADSSLIAILGAMGATTVSVSMFNNGFEIYPTIQAKFPIPDGENPLVKTGQLLSELRGKGIVVFEYDLNVGSFSKTPITGVDAKHQSLKVRVQAAETHKTELDAEESRFDSFAAYMKQKWGRK